MGNSSGKYESAASRWAGVGPYYAMFPTEFADGVVQKYTSTSDSVLDPFAGRGTAVFSAATQGRCGLGVELNPVGWVYAQAKLRPAPKNQVVERVRELGRIAERTRQVPQLPVFFSWCFTKPVLRFLLAAREHLQWRHCHVDRTLMALLLVNLHGKREASLSNQMRQTKSLAPDYAVNWWKQRHLRPPQVDPVAFLEERIRWRYAKGTPEVANSLVYLGDSTRRLGDIRERMRTLGLPRPRLLVTSPPYCGVTNYHYDQWLRRWVLGGPPNALAVPGRYRGKFYDRQNYRRLLYDVFDRAKPLLSPDAVVYVRTDRRDVTLRATIDVLAEVFPMKRMSRRSRPFGKPTQTHLFGDRTQKSGEVDVVLLPAA